VDALANSSVEIALAQSASLAAARARLSAAEADVRVNEDRFLDQLKIEVGARKTLVLSDDSLLTDAQKALPAADRGALAGNLRDRVSEPAALARVRFEFVDKSRLESAARANVRREDAAATLARLDFLSRLGTATLRLAHAQETLLAATFSRDAAQKQYDQAQKQHLRPRAIQDMRVKLLDERSRVEERSASLGAAVADLGVLLGKPGSLVRVAQSSIAVEKALDNFNARRGLAGFRQTAAARFQSAAAKAAEAKTAALQKPATAWELRVEGSKGLGASAGYSGGVFLEVPLGAPEKNYRRIAEAKEEESRAKARAEAFDARVARDRGNALAQRDAALARDARLQGWLRRSQYLLLRAVLESTNKEIGKVAEKARVLDVIRAVLPLLENPRQLSVDEDERVRQAVDAAVGMAQAEDQSPDRIALLATQLSTLSQASAAASSARLALIEANQRLTEFGGRTEAASSAAPADAAAFFRRYVDNDPQVKEAEAVLKGLQGAAPGPLAAFTVERLSTGVRAGRSLDQDVLRGTQNAVSGFGARTGLTADVSLEQAFAFTQISDKTEEARHRLEAERHRAELQALGDLAGLIEAKDRLARAREIAALRERNRKNVEVRADKLSLVSELEKSDAQAVHNKALLAVELAITDEESRTRDLAARGIPVSDAFLASFRSYLKDTLKTSQNADAKAYVALLGVVPGADPSVLAARAAADAASADRLLSLFQLVGPARLYAEASQSVEGSVKDWVSSGTKGLLGTVTIPLRINGLNDIQIAQLKVNLKRGDAERLQRQIVFGLQQKANALATTRAEYEIARTRFELAQKNYKDIRDKFEASYSEEAPAQAEVADAGKDFVLLSTRLAGQQAALQAELRYYGVKTGAAAKNLALSQTRAAARLAGALGVAGLAAAAGSFFLKAWGLDVPAQVTVALAGVVAAAAGFSGAALYAGHLRDINAAKALFSGDLAPLDAERGAAAARAALPASLRDVPVRVNPGLGRNGAAEARIVDGRLELAPWFARLLIASPEEASRLAADRGLPVMTPAGFDSFREGLIFAVLGSHEALRLSMFRTPVLSSLSRVPGLQTFLLYAAAKPTAALLRRVTGAPAGLSAEGPAVLPAVRRNLLGPVEAALRSGAEESVDAFAQDVNALRFIEAAALFAPDSPAASAVPQDLRALRFMSAAEVGRLAAAVQGRGDLASAGASVNALALRLLEAGGRAEASGSAPAFAETLSFLRALAPRLAPAFHVSIDEAAALRAWDRGRAAGDRLRAGLLSKDAVDLDSALAPSGPGLEAHVMDSSADDAVAVELLARQVYRLHRAGAAGGVIVPLVTNRDALDVDSLRDRVRAEVVRRHPDVSAAQADRLLAAVRFGEVTVTAQDLRAAGQEADPAVQIDTDLLAGLLQARIRALRLSSADVPLSLFTDDADRFKKSWIAQGLTMLLVSADKALRMTSDIAAEALRDRIVLIAA
jgi:hypothetical protein